MAARHAALRGLRVLLIDKTSDIGNPLRCAEAVSKPSLAKAGVKVDATWVSAEISGFSLVSPRGKAFNIDLGVEEGGAGVVLERHLFDKALAAHAARAGAEIMLKTETKGLITEGAFVRGVEAVRCGRPVTFMARCVVGADGYESRVGKWGGIDTSLKASDIVSCLQYRMAGVTIEPNLGQFFLGGCAPGGYIWIFPKGPDTANVGIGILVSSLRSPQEVKQRLDAFIKHHPGLSHGQPLQCIAGSVPVCAPLSRVTGEGLLLVGDAARVTDPLTGAGIGNACITGMFAGQVLAECAETGDFSKSALHRYEKLWRVALEQPLLRNWRLKEKLVTISDDVWDSLIETIAEAKIREVTVRTLLEAIRHKHKDLAKELDGVVTEPK